MKRTIIGITLGIFSLGSYAVDSSKYFSFSGKKTIKAPKKYKSRYGKAKGGEVSRGKHNKTRKFGKVHRGRYGMAQWGIAISRGKYGKAKGGKVFRGRYRKRVPSHRFTRHGRRGIVTPMF